MDTYDCRAWTRLIREHEDWYDRIRGRFSAMAPTVRAEATPGLLMAGLELGCAVDVVRLLSTVPAHEGWSIVLDQDSASSRVYHDGVELSDVTAVEVTCQAGDVVRATIKIVAPRVVGHVDDAHAKAVAGAPKVAGEEEVEDIHDSWILTAEVLRDALRYDDK